MPGTLYFYTRLKSPVSTTVQHRWYRGDQLYMVVTLHVGVNTASGWRTDSRISVPEGSGGDWRVELRSGDGAVGWSALLGGTARKDSIGCRDNHQD